MRRSQYHFCAISPPPKKKVCILNFMIKKQQKKPQLRTFYLGEFPGSPVVRTPHSHCRGPGFDPWLGNRDPASHTVQPKKKKKKILSNNWTIIVKSVKPREPRQDWGAVPDKSWLKKHGNYLARLSFRFDGERKSFTDKQKLKEFSTTETALQEMLKGLLGAEKKKPQLEIWKLWEEKSNW